MGSGEIILHRLLRHINAGKSSLCLLRAETDTRPNDPSENIRGEGRFHSHTLQGPPLLGLSLLPLSKLSNTLHFPSCTWRQMSDGDGRDGPPGVRSVSACIYISHTPASSLRGMRSLSPNRETLTSALKGCWIVFRDWRAFAMGTGQAVRALFESVIRVVQI